MPTQYTLKVSVCLAGLIIIGCGSGNATSSDIGIIGDVVQNPDMFPENGEDAPPVDESDTGMEVPDYESPCQPMLDPTVSLGGLLPAGFSKEWVFQVWNHGTGACTFVSAQVETCGSDKETSHTKCDCPLPGTGEPLGWFEVLDPGAGYTTLKPWNSLLLNTRWTPPSKAEYSGSWPPPISALLSVIFSDENGQEVFVPEMDEDEGCLWPNLLNHGHGVLNSIYGTEDDVTSFTSLWAFPPDQLPGFRLMVMESDPKAAASYLQGHLSLSVWPGGESVPVKWVSEDPKGGGSFSLLTLTPEPEAPLDEETWYMLRVSDLPQDYETEGLWQVMLPLGERDFGFRFSPGSDPHLQRLELGMYPILYMDFSERLYGDQIEPDAVVRQPAGGPEVNCSWHPALGFFRENGSRSFQLDCDDIDPTKSLELEFNDALFGHTGVHLVPEGETTLKVVIPPDYWMDSGSSLFARPDLIL